MDHERDSTVRSEDLKDLDLTDVLAPSGRPTHPRSTPLTRPNPRSMPTVRCGSQRTRVFRPGRIVSGICAALHADGRIETSCPDCGQSMQITVRDQRPDGASLLFHCLVPAAHWWDDIVFT